MPSDLYIWGIACYCGGVLSVLIGFLAPAATAWWQDYRNRHQFPTFMELKTRENIREFQRRASMDRRGRDYEGISDVETLPPVDVA